MGKFVITFDDYLLSRKESPLDHCLVSGFRPQLDEAFFSYAVIAQDEDIGCALLRDDSLCRSAKSTRPLYL